MRKWTFILLFFGLTQCREPKAPRYEHCLDVTATAYNSLRWQTWGNPNETAWGDTLKPGMRAIAVSRDLLDSGLTHNRKVYIRELNDTFIVKDKMHRRWRKKIDIYFGLNRDSARAWGRRKVTVEWE